MFNALKAMRNFTLFLRSSRRSTPAKNSSTALTGTSEALHTSERARVTGGLGRRIGAFSARRPLIFLSLSLHGLIISTAPFRYLL
ncbi:hypothetical protein BGM19_33970 [Streptomyces agglomeratus]|nr:hypothetical protein BGM19_33970 [Streptomyces agglomeratus]